MIHFNPIESPPSTWLLKEGKWVGRPWPGADAPAHLWKPGILVVEKDDLVRGILSLGLAKNGFAVWLAATVQEALAVYGRHGRAIDLVLVDDTLADGDGKQTLAALEQLHPATRCCFMTGSSDNHTQAQLLELGAAVVITKPFRLDDIWPTLWQLALSL